MKDNQSNSIDKQNSLILREGFDESEGAFNFNSNKILTVNNNSIAEPNGVIHFFGLSNSLIGNAPSLTGLIFKVIETFNVVPVEAVNIVRADKEITLCYYDYW